MANLHVMRPADAMPAAIKYSAVAMKSLKVFGFLFIYGEGPVLCPQSASLPSEKQCDFELETVNYMIGLRIMWLGNFGWVHCRSKK